MKKILSQSGFSLVELMVTVALLGIIGTAGFIVFDEGQEISSVVLARVEVQNSMRHFSQRFLLELQESGTDRNDVFQVTIINGGGANNTDVIRFAVPVCPCGTLPIDDDGEVAAWGAPLSWGQSGCQDPYPLEQNGKVEICHLPPGNPNNEQDLQVSENAVKAHLAHGDRIGECDSCDPDNYTNRTIEYTVDASNRLLRRVLDSGGTVINSVVAAMYVADFQLAFDAGQDRVMVAAQFDKQARQRTISLNGNWSILLRNKD